MDEKKNKIDDFSKEFYKRLKEKNLTIEEIRLSKLIKNN